jgi:hypothetical protein
MGKMMPQGVTQPAQSMGFSGPPHALPPPQTIVATQRGASENDASERSPLQNSGCFPAPKRKRSLHPGVPIQTLCIAP